MASKPTYNYTKYRSKHLTVEQLDLLVKLSLVVPVTKVDAIIKGLQLLVFSTAVFARRSLIKEEMAIDKAEYERRKTQEHKREVDEINLPVHFMDY